MRKPLGINDVGMSLIEVVVALGVMTAMMMGFMTMLNNQSKATSFLEDKLSRVSLETELRLQFSNPGYCTDLFKNTIAPLKDQNLSNVQNLLKAPTQTAALKKVFTQRDGKTTYNQLELHQVALENSTVPGPNSSGTVNIVFYPTRLRTGGGPSSLQPIKIKSQVQVDDSSKIVSCQPEADSFGQSCQLTDIFTTTSSPIRASVPTRTKFFGSHVKVPNPKYEICWMDKSAMKGSQLDSFKMIRVGSNYTFDSSINNVTVESGSGVFMILGRGTVRVQTGTANGGGDTGPVPVYSNQDVTNLSSALCQNGKWVFPLGPAAVTVSEYFRCPN